MTEISVSPIVDVVAGSVGGIAGTLVGQPFDVVKVRLQSDHSSAPSSLLSIIRHTWKTEGSLGFWRGVLPPVVAEAAINTVYFGTFAIMQRLLQSDQNSSLTTMQASFAGAVAGVTGTLVVAPAELVKIRLQVGNEFCHTQSELRRTMQVAKVLYKEEGLMAFTRGFKVTIFREIPTLAAYFGLYDYLKKTFRKQDGTLSGVGQIFAGGLAGSGAWVLTYPLDVIKTRIQAHSSHIGIVECYKQMWSAKGVRGFYQGVVPCSVRAFPVNAVIFAIYEWCLAASRNVF